MSQSNPSSSDAYNDSLSFVKKLWGGMGVPGVNTSGMNAPIMPGFGMQVPSMSLEDMDKRIQELKTVESWLNVNMSMLHNTIQALEIQRATIAALHSLSSTMAQTMQGASSPEVDPAAVPDIAATNKTSSSSATPNSQAGAANPTDVSPLISQSAAWWNGVQEQFKQALGAALAADSSAPKPTPDGSAKLATETQLKAKDTPDAVGARVHAANAKAKATTPKSRGKTATPLKSSAKPALKR